MRVQVGLRKVESVITVKLNNLSAGECNMIRLLFKGTLDHFHEVSKARTALDTHAGVCVHGAMLCA